MNTQPETAVTVRPLSVIAREILKHLAAVEQKPGKDRFYAARPYLDAMLTLGSIKENYYYDSGSSIVIYCLSNLQGWTGPNAKRVKAELKAMYEGVR